MRLPAKLLLYALMMAFVLTKVAAHELIQGRGVVCDTKAQIEMFADLGLSEAAVQAINADAPNACALIEIAYYRGATIEQVNSGELIVVEILVVAFKQGVEWIRLKEPALQYTLFEEPGKGV